MRRNPDSNDGGGVTDVVALTLRGRDASIRSNNVSLSLAGLLSKVNAD